MAKSRNFDSFGAVFPHFCPDKCEIWHGERTWRLSGQRVAPAGEKPILDHWVKTVPAGNKKKLFRLQPARDPRSPPYTSHGDRGGPSHFCTPNYFNPISSFAARGYWKFVGTCPTAGESLLLGCFSGLFSVQLYTKTAVLNGFVQF